MRRERGYDDWKADDSPDKTTTDDPDYDWHSDPHQDHGDRD